MNESESYQNLRAIWIAVSVSAVVMVTVFTILFTTQEAPRTPAAEQWFYANAVVNFAAVITAFALHFRYGQSLYAASFRTEALRFAYLQRFSVLLVLYAAAIFAALATYMGGELINLFLTSTFFLAAFYLYPSKKKMARLVGDQLVDENDRENR